MKLRDFVSNLDQETCLAILPEIEAFEETGQMPDDATLRLVAEEYTRAADAGSPSITLFLLLGAEIWRRMAYGTLPAANWQTNLNNAPHKTPQGSVIMAILPNHGFPEAVKWAPHPDDIAKQLGEIGYWDYESDNISELTGGIEEKEAEKAIWSLFSLPSIPQ